MPIEVSLTTEQQVRVRATPKTLTGRPAALDGPLTAMVVTGDGSVAPGADDLEVVLKSGDAPGDTTFLISGDADLGEGVVSVEDTVTLHVAGALAANLGLAASAPEDKS